VVVIADSDQHEITILNPEQHAQSETSAAFVVSPNWTNARAGMLMRVVKYLRNLQYRCAHDLLLIFRQIRESAIK
jgi:adenosylmethionine-8-amino-7-oxononanoate aminotransferase